jgi:hypothetical protein
MIWPAFLPGLGLSTLFMPVHVIAGENLTTNLDSGSVGVQRILQK